MHDKNIGHSGGVRMTMKPLVGVAIGVALLAAGVGTSVVSFYVSGVFMLLVSIGKMIWDRRGGSSA
jgi:hypothetical protein